MEVKRHTIGGVKTVDLRRKPKFSNIKDLELSLMIAVPFLLLVVFSYLPMLGLVIAFKDFRPDLGILGSPWVWFDNFKFLFTSQDAFRITQNTVLFNIAFIVTHLLGGLIFSIVLNEITNRTAIKIYQTTMFMPYILSAAVVAFIVHSFLDMRLGFVNKFLQNAGFEEIMWYSEKAYWPYILVIVHFWKSIGYNIIIFYAALMGIDSTYYEAAVIDGATKWQSIRHITIPLLMPITITLFLLSIGRIFYADFGLFYMVTKDSGSLYSVTDVIDTYVYRALRVGGDYGLASATGFYQSIVGFFLVLFSNWLVKKYDKEAGLF